MSTILEPLINSPRLKEYAGELMNIISREKERRNEFLNSVSESDKAEFINGEIIMQSPATKGHLTSTWCLANLIGNFVEINDLGIIFIEKAMVSLSRNDYEPDVCYFSKEKSDSFATGQRLFPAPELIVEVLSKTTEKRDRGVKFEDYALHGIEEYWIVDPEKKILEQYLLLNKKYKIHFKGKTGIVKCSAIRGLEFPVKAIFDKKENLEAVKKMMR